MNSYFRADPKSLSPFTVILALFAVSLWGANFPVSKLAMEHCPPILLMSLRLGAGGFFLVLFARRPFTWSEWNKVAALSVTQYGINFALCASGIFLTGAGVASVITLMDVPFSFLLAAIILGERLEFSTILGTAVALLGTAIVTFPGTATSSLVGCLMLLGASFAYALSTIQAKQIQLDPFSTMAWGSLLAAPQLLLASYLIEGSQWTSAFALWGTTQSLYVIFLIVTSSAAFSVWIHLLRNHKISHITPFILLLPVVAIAGGALFLGEHLTVTAALGGSIVIAGVAMTICFQTTAPAANHEHQ